MRSDRAAYFVLCTAISVGALGACSGDESGGKKNAGGGGGKDGGSAGAESDASDSAGGKGTGGASSAGGARATGGASPASGGAAGAPDSGPSGCTLASEWTIVDDYTHPGANHTNPNQLLATAEGTIYATGLALSAGVATGLLRASTDGTTFTLVKEVAGIGGDLVELADGTLLVAGGDAGGNRVVRRSTDAGKNWAPVDSVPLTAAACNTGYLAVTKAGKIDRAGSCDDEGWRVRVSADGGDSWDDVGAAYQLEAGMPARLASIGVDGAGEVYLSGAAQDADQIAHWIVRQLGTDGSFETVDDFQAEAGKSTSAPILSASERLYAAGSAEEASGWRWVVRRADAAGAAWTTLDDYSPAAVTSVTARAVHESPDGVITVVGEFTAGGVASAVTRRSTNDGKTWADIDTWNYADGKSAAPTGGLVTDPKGNLYGAFRGVAADDHAHWVVRRMACAP